MPSVNLFKKLSSKLSNLFLSCIFLLSVILPFHNSYAIYEGVRSIGYDSDRYMCDGGEFKFDPFSYNKDINWDLTNPTCASYISSVGAVLFAQEKLNQYVLCYPSAGNLVASSRAAQATDQVIMGPFLPPYPNPGTLLKIAAFASVCATKIADNSVAAASCAPLSPTPWFCSSLALTSSDLTRCCAGSAAYATEVSAAIAALSIIWDKARITFENGRICGNDWKQWAQEDGNWIKDKGPYQNCLIDLFQANDSTQPDSCKTYGIGENSADFETKITNKYYREFIYGGKEFEDNGEGSCSNPSNRDAVKSDSGIITDYGYDRNTTLGYDSDGQRYYMTGAASTPVYACHRFLSRSVNANNQAAYDCCKRRSQNAICIENKSGIGDELGPYRHKFCEIGSRCAVGSEIIFEVYASKAKPNYVCAKTYSVCPYNHLLGGGTETQQVDSSDTTQVTNYCQYMNHCSKLPILPYIRSVSFDGQFISSACYDMKGDSQNVYGYTAQLIPINNRGFSAPMAQCFKETMENIFLNIVGHSECIDSNESPNSDGYCSSGYAYKKGNEIQTKSFFLKIQDALQDIIKLALTISITFFGYKVLMGVPGEVISRKKLLPYIVKMGLVMYFAVGDGWQAGFMTGVLRTSSFLSELTFKVDESEVSSKLDGCQFPRFNYADESEITKYDSPAYSSDNQYLRIWDTLDCKLARALGFGPEVSVPNLIFMILGGFLTGGLGIVFVIASFMFAFLLISIVIRALHIFLLSTTSVIILIYVSPITITLAMFKKTRQIYTSWWKQLMGFTLQPMILFAYLGILITCFDKIIIGDATFSGDGAKSPKKIICQGEALNNSIYCIFKIADIKTLHGLEPLGVGLPVLASMNQAKLNTIIKSAFIMFILMSFLDQISGFASRLVGGAELKSEWGGSEMAGKMASKAGGVLKGIQDRGMNSLKKYGQKAGGFAARRINAMSNRGKSVSDAREKTSADHITSSSTGAVSDTTTSSSKSDDLTKSSTDNKNSSDHTNSPK